MGFGEGETVENAARGAVNHILERASLGFEDLKNKNNSGYYMCEDCSSGSDSETPYVEQRLACHLSTELMPMTSKLDEDASLWRLRPFHGFQLCEYPSASVPFFLNRTQRALRQAKGWKQNRMLKLWIFNLRSLCVVQVGDKLKRVARDDSVLRDLGRLANRIYFCHDLTKPSNGRSWSAPVVLNRVQSVDDSYIHKSSVAPTTLKFPVGFSINHTILVALPQDMLVLERKAARIKPNYDLWNPICLRIEAAVAAALVNEELAKKHIEKRRFRKRGTGGRHKDLMGSESVDALQDHCPPPSFREKRRLQATSNPSDHSSDLSPPPAPLPTSAAALPAGTEVVFMDEENNV